MRVRIGGAVELVAVAIVVAGCTGSEQPSALPDTTTAASAAPTTESPTATPTGDPTAQLEAEITDFFYDYIETSNASWLATDALARRRQMFADSCAACLYGYQLALRAHEENLTFEGELGKVEEVRIDAIEGDVARFSGFTSTPAARLVRADGSIVEEFPATSNLQVAYQAQQLASGEWVIIQSEVLG
jgi:hypothetical protein